MASGRLLAYIVSILLIIDIAVAGYALLQAPFPLRVDLGAPTAYLTIYIHVPMAWASYILFTLALVGGILYLKTQREFYDRLTLYAALFGELYGIGTIVTGMAWAHESWGAAWNWDPRETAVLLLILVYLGYFAVRSSIRDPEKRRQVAATYAVAAYSMVPLSFIIIYTLPSLHPQAEQAVSFFRTRQVMEFFAPRAILVSVNAIGLVLLAAKGVEWRKARIPAAVILVVGLAVALHLLSPYLAGTPVRVINATLSDGGISYIETTGGAYTFQEPVESPVKPPEADGQPSIIGHLVEVRDGSVELVVHWAAPFALIVYSLLVSTALVLATTPRLLRGVM